MTVCYVPLLNGKQIKSSASGLLEQAKKLNDKVIALIVHSGINEVNLQLDCDEIHLIELSEEMWPIASNHIAAFEKFQKDRTEEAVLFSASPLANEIAAGLGFKLNRPIVNQVMEAARKDQYLSIKKEIYGGKACLYEETALGSIITYDPVFLPHMKNSVNRKIPNFHPIMNIMPSKNIKFVESKKLSWEEIGLTEATCVIGVGRGVYSAGGGSQLKQIEELAKILNAPIGGSKVADELKLIPRERRIGSSGVSLDQADIYIAIGISGSSQHLDGIKNVKHVLAINNDAAAPIFKRSDLGIVSDFETAIPLLVDIIKDKSGVKYSENTSYREASV
ncbi:electron transfer flavoprotein subunit alpha [Siminovitchia terrae]|uniref:Electron transfer flavoprotein subunit alpha n=1 Tax=Siminovitchia terrae TaxID=1914933 RepID=A0A429X333_SIMTE|nr:electron transfer flavoprotein subunit alpha/FixB family protein [Siminovitchia terrae]RST57770.1 electron transfer flavoprotein subunit alpha/FixB family protein [Siminovitchia terrae]GIN91175.1 electron transfer flavoprotein subunit alpha [Siminovitchia terrae]GIN94912.1 electron transfer flavoprotein subunit alpha [Siminovitchia terrae]